MFITKKTLEYLAELGRIELEEKSEEKLLKDLREILAYFEELKNVDTENVEPMAGGTIEKNVFRQDEELTETQNSLLRSKSPEGQPKTQNPTEAFPQEENGFLKIPPVFE